MASLNSNALLFNVVGGAILATVVGYMGYSHFRSKDATPCSVRYASGGQQFGLERDAGVPMTPVEFQGRAGWRQWGVLSNLKVAKSTDVPSKVRLDVVLQSTGNDDKPDENGAGFTWLQPDLATAQSACLSYLVRLPDGFDFSETGHLPGLFGANDAAALDELNSENAFALRLGWSREGQANVLADLPGGSRPTLNARSKNRWPLNRWVRVDQEVVLNHPAKANGVVRVWLNGELLIQYDHMRLRTKPDLALMGLVGDTGYTRKMDTDKTISLSEFVIKGQ